MTMYVNACREKKKKDMVNRKNIMGGSRTWYGAGDE